MSTTAHPDPLRPDDVRSDLGDFGHLVRDALAHLYDTMHLQTHPLTRLLPQLSADRTAMVGKALRRSLLDAIESMRPPAGTASTSKIHQKYRILEMRYVEEVDPTDIQRQLALSKTEYYREHGQALAAITSALQEKWNVGDAGKKAPVARDPTPLELAEQEAKEICSRMQLELLDVRDTVREVMGILEPLCRRQATVLGVDMPSAPCHTRADRVGLRQALLNAIRKAMDVTAPGRLDVRVTVGPTGVAVEIRGIASVPPSLAPPLDLTVARCLVEYTGGRVEVDGFGDLVVTISLPSTPRSRLLVIDNNQDFVGLVARYLNQEGWDVIGAVDAERAKHILESTVPDLILLDVMMPGCDGWEFLRQLKSSQRTSTIPVVICSVLDDEQLADALGADGYLLKPLSQRDLVHALRPWQASRNAAGPGPEGSLR